MLLLLLSVVLISGVAVVAGGRRPSTIGLQDEVAPLPKPTIGTGWGKSSGQPF